MTEWRGRIPQNEPPERIGDIVAGAMNTEVTEGNATPIRALYDFSFKSREYYTHLDIATAVERFMQSDMPYKDPVLYESMLRQEQTMAANNPLLPISEAPLLNNNVLDLAVFVAKRMAMRSANNANFVRNIAQMAVPTEDARNPVYASLTGMGGDLNIRSGGLQNTAKNLMVLRSALEALSGEDDAQAHGDRIKNLQVLSVAPEIIGEACDAFNTAFVVNNKLETDNQKRAKDRTVAHVAALNEFVELLSPAIQKAQGELKGYS